MSARVRADMTADEFRFTYILKTMSLASLLLTFHEPSRVHNLHFCYKDEGDRRVSSPYNQQKEQKRRQPSDENGDLSGVKNQDTVYRRTFALPKLSKVESQV